MEGILSKAGGYLFARKASNISDSISSDVNVCAYRHCPCLVTLLVILPAFDLRVELDFNVSFWVLVMCSWWKLLRRGWIVWMRCCIFFGMLRSTSFWPGLAVTGHQYRRRCVTLHQSHERFWAKSLYILSLIYFVAEPPVCNPTFSSDVWLFSANLWGIIRIFILNGSFRSFAACEMDKLTWTSLRALCLVSRVLGRARCHLLHVINLVHEFSSGARSSPRLGFWWVRLAFGK